jgi:hypothetical protein
MERTLSTYTHTNTHTHYIYLHTYIYITDFTLHNLIIQMHDKYKNILILMKVSKFTYCHLANKR